MKVNWRIKNDDIFEKNPVPVTELPEEQMFKVMDQLKNSGVDEISFSCGEMLATKNAENVLKTTSEKGFKTAVTTSARLLSKEKFDNIQKYLNKLTLTLDFENDKIGREQGEIYIDYLTKLIKHINKVNPKLGVDVNTIVCLENMAYLLGMSKELEKVNIKNWNLYEFSSLRGKMSYYSGKTEAPEVSYKEVIRFLREHSRLPIREFAKKNLQHKAVINLDFELKRVLGDNEICLLKDINERSMTVLSHALTATLSPKLKHCNIENNKIKPIEMLY